MATPAPNNKAPKTVYYLGVLRVTNNKAQELVSVKDLSSFAWLTQSKYGEAIDFAVTTVAARTPVGQRNAVEEEKFGKIHCYHTSLGFCVAMVTELSYKQLAAQEFLNKTADQFTTKFTQTDIKSKQAPFQWPELKDLRTQATEAKGIDAVQAELDETMIVLHKTIESVLERGERLDALVAKSDELSGLSKGFYKQAKQQNSCCTVM